MKLRRALGFAREGKRRQRNILGVIPKAHTQPHMGVMRADPDGRRAEAALQRTRTRRRKSHYVRTVLWNLDKVTLHTHTEVSTTTLYRLHGLTVLLRPAVLHSHTQNTPQSTLSLHPSTKHMVQTTLHTPRTHSVYGPKKGRNPGPAQTTVPPSRPRAGCDGQPPH